MNPEEEISQSLIQVGSKLQKIGNFNAPDLREEDLREVREGTKRLQRLTTKADNREVRADAYVLWTLLDDMWDNIAMVPSTHIEDETITNLLEPMGAVIEDIGEQYDRMTGEEFYDKFTEIYDAYIGIMAAINKDLTEGTLNWVSKNQ